MSNEYITEFTNNLKEKLGDTSYATISDDIGTLITKNNETITDITNKDNEISELKNRNEKLVLANGSLLKQIPVGNVKKEENKEVPKEKITFTDLFDEKGHFKK